MGSLAITPLTPITPTRTANDFFIVSLLSVCLPHTYAFDAVDDAERLQ
jgi:hypothetical protein